MAKILDVTHCDTTLIKEREQTYNVNTDVEVSQLHKREKSLDLAANILILLCIVGGIVFLYATIWKPIGLQYYQFISCIVMGTTITIERILSLFM